MRGKKRARVIIVDHAYYGGKPPWWERWMIALIAGAAGIAVGSRLTLWLI